MFGVWGASHGQGRAVQVVVGWVFKQKLLGWAVLVAPTPTAHARAALLG